MKSTVIVIQMNQVEPAVLLSDVDRAQTVKNILEANNVVVEQIQVIAVHDPMKEIREAGVFDTTEPETPVIPYQGAAKLQVQEGGEYLDVIGNDGKVLCSFDKADARKALLGMNR